MEEYGGDVIGEWFITQDSTKPNLSSVRVFDELFITEKYQNKGYDYMTSVGWNRKQNSMKSVCVNIDQRHLLYRGGAMMIFFS